MKKIIIIILLFSIIIILSIVSLEVFLRLCPRFTPFYLFNNKHYVNLYVVGESTGFGCPYDPKISYPKIVSYMLGNKVLEKDINIVNLSKPGCKSVDQYWILFRELYLRPPPKDSILLIYVGINEWANAQSNKHPLLKRFIDKSICLSKLIYLFNSGLYLDTIDYESRLRDIIELGNKYKLYIVISNLCGNYADFDPKDAKIFGNDDDANLLIEKTEKLEKTGNFDKAYRIYEKLLESKAIAHDHVYFRLGEILVGMGNYKKAQEYFFKAADLNWNWRPTRYQNRVIKELSREYGIDFVDTVQVFMDNSPNGIIGFNLFFDAHHPNLKGYILMAKAFAGKIAKHYNTRVVKAKFNENEIMNCFGFSDKDLFYAHIRGIKYLLAGNIKRADYYLKTADDIYGRSPKNIDVNELYLAHLLVDAFKHDKSRVIYWLEKGDFLNTNRKYIETGGNGAYNRWVKYWLLKLDLPKGMIEKIRDNDNKDYDKAKLF